jgi:RNA polymerase sigma-70 factor (ECF subfamily)
MSPYTTHATLLARLSQGYDPVAWREFVERYGELIRAFARRHDLQPADCDEVVQDVLTSLAQSMPGFRYDPARGKFRAYLKTVALHAIYRKNRQKRGEVSLEEVEAAADVAASETASGAVDALWEAEWKQYHLRLAMRTVEREFGERDRLAFEKYALEGRDAAATAGELGLSVDSVYQAKSRILKRLSQLVAAQVREEG